MKEHGDNLSSEKLLRDQELHHLVTSSIPSPPYHAHTGLSLINAQAGLVLDPLYQSRWLASLVAANANAQNQAAAAAARFQLPIPIHLALQPASHQPLLQPHLHHQQNLFHHLPGTTPAAAFAGVPGATPAQLDILSSWVAATSAADDKKITSTTSTTPPTSTPNSLVSHNNNNNKSANNSGSKSAKKRNSVSARNQKNMQQHLHQTPPKQKRGRAKKNGGPDRGKLVHDGVVSSSENELPLLKDAKMVVVDSKEPMMTINESVIQPFLYPSGKIPSSPTTPKRKAAGENGAGSPQSNLHHHINNNNNVVVSQNGKGGGGQTSPGSGGQNGGPRDKVFTCPTCHRCFGYKHVLQNHERTHTGEKPFECSICLKKFTRDHHLKTHMRLHTGEKPYQCTHCDRQFVQVANLRRHLRVHTGERPYACELCSSRFSDSNQLKAHMLIHKDTSAEMPANSSLDDMDDEEETTASNSPPQLVTPSSTAEKREGSGKRGRKSRETRRIIRLEGLPVAASAANGSGKGTAALPTFVVPPEQDAPEDLSMTGGLRVRHYSGSSSSVTASSTPSPRGPSLMLLSTRPYSSSSSFEEPADVYGSEEEEPLLRATHPDSSTNAKLATENESSSMSD